MLKFNSIKKALEYKGTDEVVIIADEEEWRCKRHINPDESIGGYVDSTSIVNDTCYLGDDCIIYNNVRLRNHVIIKDNTIISNNVYIFDNVNIISKVCIYNNVNIYDNVKISNGVRINDNVRICRNVNIIGDVHIFSGVSIYDNVEICNRAHIYSGATIAYGSYITKQDDFMTVGNVGSRDSIITFTKNKEGTVLVHTGCFHGTEEEFIKAVNKTHGDNKHGKVYMNLLETFKLKQIN